jgi:hypothetical protein
MTHLQTFDCLALADETVLRPYRLFGPREKSPMHKNMFSINPRTDRFSPAREPLSMCSFWMPLRLGYSPGIDMIVKLCSTELQALRERADGHRGCHRISRGNILQGCSTGTSRSNGLRCDRVCHT